ncbi:MAG: hypothetical protein A2X02_03630 [Bacteroidetes bacterium GWF2_29_10]|nr:MAG: hypothetical protein A2X02_03630 [Bacteroidetes bacterium GWF2_29_10]
MNEDFNTLYSSRFYSSGGSQSAGTYYTCSFDNGVALFSSTTSPYLVTKTMFVPQGKDLKIDFKLSKASTYTSSPDVYIRFNDATSFNTSDPTDKTWTKILTASYFSCLNNTVTIPTAIAGGQRFSIAIHFKNASTSNWVAIDDLVVTAVNGVAVPTTYTENFTTNKWYPTSGYVKIPYYSSNSSASAYSYLWTGGASGTFDYYVAFSTGYDTPGSTKIITPEINTYYYANGELSFMYKAMYPCGGPAGATYDEDYSFYAPKVYIMKGGDCDTCTWKALNVKYAFADGTWRKATVDISDYRYSNIRLKFERGGTCSNPYEGIDNIKVFDRSCKLSGKTAGAISGTNSPGLNENTSYSILDSNADAKYYKWMLRKDANLYETTPYIVSGQGTKNVVINLNGTTASSIKLLCIPYDAKPDTQPDACYASTAFMSLTPKPNLPVAIAATNVTNMQFTANWNTALLATKYYIDVATDANFTSFVLGYENLDAGSATNFIITGLAEHTYYYYRVRAANDKGSSNNSNVISIKTKGKPPVPNNLEVLDLGRTKFVANWNSSMDATKYYIDVATDGTFSNIVAGFNNKLLNSTDTTFLVEGLLQNITYYYRIKASNEYGTSLSSNVISVVTTCPMPYNLNVPSTSSITALLTWKKLIDSEYYLIRWRVKGSTTWSYYNAPGNTSSVVVGDLTANTVYEWQMRNWCNLTNSYSPFSPFNEFATSSGIGCDMATNLIADSITTTSAKLTWVRPSKGYQYYLRYALNGSSSWTYVTLDSTATSYTVTGLTSTTSYQWQMRTFCQGGTVVSNFTPIYNFTTLNNCNAPSGLLTNNITSSKAVLNWNSVTGANYILVRYRIQAGLWKYLWLAGTAQVVQIGCDVCAPADKLQPNTTYEWQIRSVCDVDKTVYSNFTDIETFNTLPLKKLNENILTAKNNITSNKLSIYPNPFKNQTTVSYSVKENSLVNITVYNLLGEKVATLVDEQKVAGNHKIEFQSGNEKNNGIYIVRLNINGEILQKKIVEISE